GLNWPVTAASAAGVAWCVGAAMETGLNWPVTGAPPRHRRGAARAAMETGLNWPVTEARPAGDRVADDLPQWRPALIGRLRPIVTPSVASRPARRNGDRP